MTTYTDTYPEIPSDLGSIEVHQKIARNHGLTEING
jgi:hypothetical protein